MKPLRIFGLLATVAIAAISASCGGSSGTAGPPVVPPPPPPPPPPAPASFHCAADSSCPELMIGGDPFAVAGSPLDVFRGYGDPSLEFDAATGTLWLAYSWLDVLVSDPGPPAVVDFAVRTHLARSDDNGMTFSFVRSVNEAEPEVHPDSGMPGWSTHEVSTLTKQPDGQWQIQWLQYFDPEGESAERGEYRYYRSLASDPTALGDNAESWIRGAVLSPSYTVQHDLSQIPQLSDCSIFTEPGLYSDASNTWLTSTCVVIDAMEMRQPTQERNVLLREEVTGYTYIGELLTASDAADLNADRIEQVEISRARDGSLILIVTPIVDNADPMHQGCVIFDIDDLASASVVRDSNGRAVPRTIITADGNGLGPGLCSYDANSETGVLLVITTVQLSPPDIEFSLRATGIHP